MKQRIWFVSEVFHPENEGAAYYISEIAFAAAREASVFALCTPPTYSHKGTSVPKRETCEDVEICRCFSTKWNRHKMSGRLVNAATFCMSVFFHLLFRMKKGDIVVSTCYPPPVSFSTLLAAKLRRGKHVVYVMDIHPDMAVAAGMLKSKSFTVKMADRVNRWIYGSSDKVIVIGRDMKSYIETKFKASPDKIDSIPLFVDSDEIRPTDRKTNELLARHNILDKFVIGVAGNIGAPHDAEALLEAVRKTTDLEDLRFFVIGSGKRYDWLQDQVQKEGMNNIVFADRLPRSEACLIANACDAAVSALFITGMFGLACPSRTGGILAAGKPLIALIEPETELAALIEEHQIGWRANPGDTPHFVQAVRDAYHTLHDEEQAEVIREKARAIAVEELGKATILNRYLESMLHDFVKKQVRL